MSNTHLAISIPLVGVCFIYCCILAPAILYRLAYDIRISMIDNDFKRIQRTGEAGVLLGIPLLITWVAVAKVMIDDLYFIFG